jgi:hypothetical protein
VGDFQGGDTSIASAIPGTVARDGEALPLVIGDQGGPSALPVISISHVVEELAIAQALARWIDAAFPQRCAVVPSSDTRDIPTGGRWLEEVDRALGATRVLLVVCSPASLRRPWIGFEAGCAWMKRVPVLPICHSGQRAAKLPPPLSAFPALEIEAAAFASDLFTRLAGHLQIATVAKIDQGAMRADLERACRPRQGGAPAQEAPPPAAEQAEEGAAQLLRAIAANDDPGYMVDELAAACGLTTKQTQHYIDGLLEQKLLTRRMFTGKPAQYHLSGAGKKYLVDTGVLDERGGVRRRPR